MDFHGSDDGEHDRLSDLPDFILHQIISFLPYGEAARASALSRRWKHVFNSYPIFVFDRFDLGTTNVMKVTKFRDLVLKTLQRFHRQELRMQKFDLCFTDYLDSNKTTTSWADKCLELAFRCNVEELKLDVSPQGSYNFNKKAFGARLINSNPTRFCFLKKVHLRDLVVSETMIGMIEFRCPCIEDFSLRSCTGFRTFRITKLRKLKHLQVYNSFEMRRIHVEAEVPMLEEAFLTSWTINISSCSNLRRLFLAYSSITEQALQEHISKFSLLETLTISHCYLLEKIKLSCHRLEKFSLLAMDELVEVELDAPSLKDFSVTLQGRSNLPVTLCSNNSQCALNMSVELRTNTDQFYLKLRELLGSSEQNKILTLTIAEAWLKFKDIRGIIFPPAYELEHLRVIVHAWPDDYKAFLRAIFFICHPKVLSVQVCETLTLGIALVEILCDKSWMDLTTECCSSDERWWHNLKRLEFISFTKLKRCEEVNFRLEWLA